MCVCVGGGGGDVSDLSTCGIYAYIGDLNV